MHSGQQDKSSAKPAVQIRGAKEIRTACAFLKGWGKYSKRGGRNKMLPAANPGIFSIWPFTEKFANLCSMERKKSQFTVELSAF